MCPCDPMRGIVCEWHRQRQLEVLAEPVPIEGRVELDRPNLEDDRYLVLLECGHWTHTRRPADGEWSCPVRSPEQKNDGQQLAATAPDGTAAILTSWELWDGDAIPEAWQLGGHA